MAQQLATRLRGRVAAQVDDERVRLTKLTEMVIQILLGGPRNIQVPHAILELGDGFGSGWRHPGCLFRVGQRHIKAMAIALKAKRYRRTDITRVERTRQLPALPLGRTGNQRSLLLSPSAV